MGCSFAGYTEFVLSFLQDSRQVCLPEFLIACFFAIQHRCIHSGT